MSAKCPICNWRLPFLRARPRNGQVIACPKCKSKLTFRTQWAVYSFPSMIVLLAMLFFMRVYEDFGLQIFLIGVAMVSGIAAFAVRTERFEIQDDGVVT